MPAHLRSLHAAAYRGPDALPRGAVLVVGAGPTGQQLALELARDGRRVVLAAGRHARMVRRYRGRDAFAWLHAIGALDDRIEDQADPERARRARSLVLTGTRGGEPLDLGVLAAHGVQVAGRLIAFDGERAYLARDLAAATQDADARLDRLLQRIDAHVAARPDAPHLPPPRRPAPVDLGDGPASVGLRGFGTVLWATGYRRAYPWLRVPVLGAGGELVHDRGTTPAPGLHVLGLRFQRRRDSHFIGGVGRDAAALAATLTSGAGAAAGRRPARAASRCA